MTKPRYAVPMTAAALLLLLGACGGGSGDNAPAGTSDSTIKAIKAESASPVGTPPAANEAEAQPTGNKSDETVATDTATEAAAGIAPQTTVAQVQEAGTADAAQPAPDAGAAQATAPADTPAPADAAPAAAPTDEAAPASAPQAAAPADETAPAAAQQATAPTNEPAPAAAPQAAAQSDESSAAAAPQATPQAGEASPDSAASAVAVISRAGISGEALLTMLGQRACSNPTQATGLNGSPVPPQAYELPQVHADLEVKPENYSGTTLPNKPLINAACDPRMAQYKLIQPGEHSVDIFSTKHVLHDYLNRPAPKRDFKGSRLSVPLTVTASQVTLGSQIGDAQNPYLANQTLSFARRGQVGYGVLTQWVQNDNHVRMLLVPGQKENEAKLCWNIHNLDVKRLHCMAWSQPEGWKPGDALKLEDQYIIDDRSTYPGESGMLHLHSHYAQP